MNRVVVVGAGDFGREVAAWIRSDAVFLNGDTVYFIDDNPQALSRHPHLVGQLIGPISSFSPAPGDRIVVGTSSPDTKVHFAELLTTRAASFTTFVHHSVIRADSSFIGEGSVICPNVVIASDARIGGLATLNIGSTVGHDAIVGDYASIMSHVDVMGWTKIGRGAFVGSHASVLPRVEVESESVVGAGSVVVRRVERGATVMGSPARTLRKSSVEACASSRTEEDGP